MQDGSTHAPLEAAVVAIARGSHRALARQTTAATLEGFALKQGGAWLNPARSLCECGSVGLQR
jgi:hypothetical protein